MPEPTSEAWAHIRYEYEHTDRPVEDICAEHGISSGTLRDRMRRWRWTRRRPPIPREGPPPVPTAQRETATVNPSPLSPHLGDDEREKPQREIAAFKTTTGAPPLPLAGEARSEGSGAASSEATPHAQAGEAMGAPAGSDPASIVPRLQGAVARVLPAIESIVARLAAGPQHPREMEQAGRALSSLTRTLRELNALLSQQPAPGVPYDDMPEDIDAFRENLARRIEAFVASRTGEDDEAKPEET